MTTRHFYTVILLILAARVDAYSSKECVYTFYIKTGDIIKAGTDSTINVTLGDSFGKSVRISDLEEWGLMGPRRDYFERGNLDIFSGRSWCISSPICKLKLTSDGKGPHPGWFVEYVEVTFTGPHEPCTQSIFFVNQWLAADAPPFELSVVLDRCNDQVSQPKEGRKGPFVVGKAMGSVSE